MDHRFACRNRGRVDIWGDDPSAVASSSLAPRETATRCDGGWRLSGRFPFSSGCTHAQWAIIGARCEDAAGNIATRYLLVPMREIEIIDDWHVLGLRGTGSRTLLLRDVFVPAHRTVLLRALLDGTPPGVQVHPEYDIVRAPRGYLVVFSLPPVAFALGRRALATAAAALSGRLSRGMTRMAESEVVQLRLAEAAASIDVASLLLETRRRAKPGGGGAPAEPITLEEVLRNRRDLTFGMQQIRDAVQSLWRAVRFTRGTGCGPVAADAAGHTDDRHAPGVQSAGDAGAVWAPAAGTAAGGRRGVTQQLSPSARGSGGGVRSNRGSRLYVPLPPAPSHKGRGRFT